MSSHPTPFDYHAAFTRNLGWVTEWEQAQLRSKRIAIAGMGGVGGSHLLTLTRAGIGAFHIADFDRFEQANLNRQAGACWSHLGKQKVDVMAKLALDINPELSIRTFPEGVIDDNLEAFLSDVDLFVDGLDFFALETRRRVFALCYQMGIPAITAAPLGMGVALLNFLPKKMSFEDYFRLEGHSENEQILRFIMGLSPALLQVPYLADDSRVDFKNRKVPSTAMACDLSAGIAATYALKILLKRGSVPAAPSGLHFDAYRNKFVRTWRPFGNRNPIQQLGIAILRRRFARKIGDAKSFIHQDTTENTSIGRILNLARWAPSGDNLQPWQFKVDGDAHFTIHSKAAPSPSVYDLKGWAHWLSLGTLLENIAIAASAEGLQPDFDTHVNGVPGNMKIDVSLSPVSERRRDPLLPFIKARTTQRRGMDRRHLNDSHRQQLEDSLNPHFRVLWFDNTRMKWKLGRIIYQNAHIRLTIPETYQVHKDIIEWRARFSHDRVPDQSIGLDPLTLRLMRWLMKSWKRVQFANRFLGGTTLARIQLDLLPALQCASHFVLLAKTTPQSAEDYLGAGRAIQRFWLTATKIGLQLQPQLTPLMFAYYVREHLQFSQNRRAFSKAKRLAQDLEGIIDPENISRAIFMGRVGYGKAPRARSLRKTLSELSLSQTQET